MDVKNFLAQHRLRTNPFDAEEARHDRVFSEMLTDPTAHPDFAKVLGQIDQPSSAVVFGEKGAGKTAMRLMVGKAVNEHNLTHPEKRTLLVAYDDLNPVLDRIATRHHGGADRPAEALEKVRLEDHQDAILSLAVTQLVNSIVGTSDPGAESMQLPEDTQKRLRRMPRRLRIDLAVLAALYDQPHSGTTVNRFHELRSTLRINWGVIPPALLRWLAILLTLIVGGFLGARYGNQTVVQSEQITEWINSPWPTAMAAVAAAGGLLAWGLWGWRQIKALMLAWKIRRELIAVEREVGELKSMILGIRNRELAGQPWPTPGVGNREARYQLTHRLLAVIEPLGYRSIMVLVDRVDEPTLVTGKSERMRSVIWPLLDNKFLQQTGIGIKLLLPIELRHMLYRESPDFFEEARLDKQHLVDRLAWSGTILYDLCSKRLAACREGEDPLYLTDLFEEDVSRDQLIDALDQMHQPRDAFKFLYQVIVEHCRMVPEDKPQYLIPRLTLESVRRAQAQRVQELQRGLAPA